MTPWHPIGDRPVRVGIAGLGTMGRNHLRVLGGLAGVELAALADPVPAALEAAGAGAASALASGSGVRAFADPGEMLASAALDAVVLATPTTTHLPLALAALERGIACLIEKPLAATPSEGRQIRDAALASGVPVQVGHVERFNPAVLTLGQLLGEGWLTTVFAIASRRAGPLPERIRDVGVTIDLATHDVDILSWIAGERPARVQAETAQRLHEGHEDLLFALLRFPGGTIGMLDVDWLTPAKRRQLTVLGDEGMFELDYLTQRLTFTRASGLDRPRLLGGFAPTFAGEETEIELESHEPLAAELDAFLRIVREGGRPIVDVEDGLWAVSIADALLTAAREQRVVAPSPEAG
jgi:predicted dehydrogenase